MRQCLERDCCYDFNTINKPANCFVESHLGMLMLNASISSGRDDRIGEKSKSIKIRRASNKAQ